MQKYQKATILKKGQKELLKVVFNKDEVSKDGQVFDAKWTKESNQLLSRSLSDAFSLLAPHLLWATELADKSINLDGTLDYPKWFNEGHYRDDERFANIVVTGIDLIGTEILQAVKIHGYNLVEWTDKPFKAAISTPVINLDRVPENPYALHAILDDQVQDLLVSLDAWLEKGETLSKAQQAMFDEEAA